MIFFETQRLLLRTAYIQDQEFFCTKIFSDPEVRQYLFSGKNLGREQCAETFQHEFNFDGHTPYGFAVIEERSTGRAIGFAGLIRARHLSTQEYEFGYVLARASWGQGMAMEIAVGQLNWAFNELNLPRVFALAHPQNHGSIHILEKLNLVREPDYHEGQLVRQVYCAHAKKY